MNPGSEPFHPVFQRNDLGFRLEEENGDALDWCKSTDGGLWRIPFPRFHRFLDSVPRSNPTIRSEDPSEGGSRIEETKRERWFVESKRVSMKGSGSQRISLMVCFVYELLNDGSKNVRRLRISSVDLERVQQDRTSAISTKQDLERNLLRRKEGTRRTKRNETRVVVDEPIAKGRTVTRRGDRARTSDHVSYQNAFFPSSTSNHVLWRSRIPPLQRRS